MERSLSPRSCVGGRRAPRTRAAKWLAAWSAGLWCLVSMISEANACSGPGAEEAIERAERLGWGLAFLGAAIAVPVIVTLRRRRAGRRAIWILGVLEAIHPGWWLSARIGDCGRTRVASAVVITLLLAAVAIAAMRRPRGGREGTGAAPWRPTGGGL